MDEHKGRSVNNWIAIDWGTTRLRVWLLDTQGAVVAARESDRGMGQLAPGEFEAALLVLVNDWLADGQVTQAVACGMVGARQGWIEAPYVQVPCPPVQQGSILAPVSDPRLSVRILPGLCQQQPTADVMRGEETQIAGLLATQPEFAGVICLPGTHTKWVEIAGGQIGQFRTFMTGELFALLSGQSVLRHSLQGDGWDDASFTEALSGVISRPESGTAQLFGLRAADLLQGQSPAVGRAKLSGLLIGLELAGARTYWEGQDVVLIGDARLCQRYADGLTLQGCTVQVADATGMTLAGLAAAQQTLREDQDAT
ncbi:MAG: 2-dehydro-3-deoxygalactonokinase [Thiolinea sp.]